MYKLTFWNSWPLVYQRLLLVFVLILVVAIGGLLTAFIQSPEPSYSWQQLQELQQQPLPLHSFRANGFDFSTTVNNYLVFERWSTNPLLINSLALDAYFSFLLLGLLVLFAILTALPRFWYYIGAGVAIFMLSTFQVEALGVFGLENKIPTLGIVVLLLGVTLFYQYIRISASFPERILALVVAFAITGIILSLYSTAPHPLRYLAVNTIPAAIVLLVVFMVAVAHDILASFVSLVGQGTRNSKSLQHFLIIGSIYLLNLWFAYWNKIGWIDWGVIVHPVVILVISGIVGLWGVRQREPLYQHIIPANPFGVYFIAAMALISFGLIGYLLATTQDIALLAVNDLILYTHIGYGMIFLMYIASNFLGMLAANLQVYKVLYRPTTMPYFSYRFAGLIFTLALLFYNNWMVPVNHFISGYYTSLGDLFAANEDQTLSAGYYKRAYVYAPYNQHAATALSTWEASRGNSLKQKRYLDDANSFRPTEFTFINSANTYTENRLEEVIVLQEAQRKIPGSGVLLNNLGLAYARLGIEDSAGRYFLLARNHPQTEASADMNLLALMATHQGHQNPDSLFRLVGSEAPGVASNAIAMANQQGLPSAIPVKLPGDSTLNLFTASLIGNYLINSILKPDTALLSQSIAMVHLPVNKSFKEIILLPAAHVCYAHGQINRAFQLLQEVIIDGGNDGQHNTTMGLWSLELGKPEVALTYLQPATQKNKNASVAWAVALAAAGKVNESLVAFDTLTNRKDTAIVRMVESAKRVLGGPPSWFADLNNLEKYQYLSFRVPLSDSALFDRLAKQITNEDWLARSIVERSQKLFDQDEHTRAAGLFKKLDGLHLTDASLFGEIKYFELRLLAARQPGATLEEHIQQGILFGPYHETERVYYTALKQAMVGDSIQAAKNFRWVAQNNPYFDEGVVAAASYLQTMKGTAPLVYNLLADALQVNSRSIRILKAYIPVALRRGYESYAASALATLKPLIPSASFNTYVTKNQLGTLLLQ